MIRDRRAPRADRIANSRLRPVARQQKIGNVSARNQQHKAHRAEQNQERLAGVADDQVAQRLHPKPALRIRLRKGAEILLPRELHLGIGLGERHIRLQHRHNPKKVGLVGAVRVKLEGNPEIGFRLRNEVPSQHADDGERLGVQGKGLADDIRAPGKSTLPEPVAQHHDVPPIGQVLLGREGAAHHHRGPEYAEPALADVNPVNKLRPVAGDVETRAGEVIGGDVFEHAGLLAPDHEFRNGGDATVAVRRREFALDDAVRVGIGQRLEQYRIDHGEDGRVGPDAQRKGRNGGDREPGTLEEKVQRMLDVFPEIAH
jgi:hypothetical protein